MDSITRLNATLKGRYEIERRLSAADDPAIYLAEDLVAGEPVRVVVLEHGEFPGAPWVQTIRGVRVMVGPEVPRSVADLVENMDGNRLP